MDKFIEVYEFEVDYEFNKINFRELALISFFKISDVYMLQYDNGWAIFIELDNRREFCYSLFSDKEKAYEVIDELKNKLNGKDY